MYKRVFLANGKSVTSSVTVQNSSLPSSDLEIQGVFSLCLYYLSVCSTVTMAGGKPDG